ncbi:MAG: SOS response-associated peptidase [Actinomycetota bacterium]|nr:SOS response-associated peptidase [Actinomycetota bacterium]
MCGRYAAAKAPAALVEEFEVVAAPAESLAPDYNVAPTKKVYVVLDRPDREDASLHPRSMEIARWGLVPSWAKDPSIGSRMINARAETVAEKPAFRRAFAKRRCIVPADGYFEWYLPSEPGAPVGKGGKPLKQPFYIHPADGSSLAMAGLYEWWRDPTRADDDPQAWRLTCTVITTEASDEVGRIHDRMPMTVARDDWPAWLDPQIGPEAAGPLLAPAMTAALAAYPVSTLVNNVRNNGPELLDPLREGE